MRHEQRRLTAQQQCLFQSGNPVSPQGLHPVVLFQALVAVHRLPSALPMNRAGALPPGQNQDIGRLQFAILFVATKVDSMRHANGISSLAIAFNDFLGERNKGLRAFA